MVYSMTKVKTIFIKNIYYMLTYAFSILKQSVYDEVEKEQFDNVHNLLAAILAKGIGVQLKQGLYREYQSKQENLPVLRGKIDVSGTIVNKFAKKRVLSCDYDELTENNLFNQILKMTGLLLINHSGVEPVYKDDLKKKLLFFSHVDSIDPASIKWSSIWFQRNNQAYRMLISICQLVIEGMLLTTERGEHKLASFIDEQRMCRLFERFILEYYIKEYPGIRARASQIPWALDDNVRTMLPVMQSDIMLSRGEKVLIIDAKFYTRTTQIQYDVHTVHSDNLYQIFAYVKNMDESFGEKPHEVSGMLLYARTEDAIQPDIIYKMSGNRISIKTLDINNNFGEIASQLNAIGDYIITEKQGVAI